MPKKTKKLNKARGMKISSQRWLMRQLNDPLVRKAREKGYRSRAAFKLIEIDEKFKIFKKGNTVIDLGAAPGGWSQIAQEKCGDNKVFGIDLLEIAPLPGVHFIQADFLDPESPKTISDLLKTHAGQEKADIVISDMAANTTGDKKHDHLCIITLLEEALHFTTQILKPNGTFIGKLFQGGSSDDLLKLLRQNFKTVKYFKPDSSRKDSSEIYLVALGFGK